MQLAHQPQNSLVVDLKPWFSLELDRDPSIPVAFVGRLINCLNLLHAFLIRVYLSQLFDPCVISRSRNTKEFTHRLHFVFFLVVVDRPILRCASCAFRNSVWNFFRSAFSIRSRSTSRSSFSVFTGRPIGLWNESSPSSRYIRTQALILSGLRIFSLSAIAAYVKCYSSTRRTASCLTSSL